MTTDNNNISWLSSDKPVEQHCQMHDLHLVTYLHKAQQCLVRWHCATDFIYCNIWFTLVGTF